MSSFSASFTGTDGTTPSGWTNRQNSVVIASNKAKGNTAYANNCATVTGSTFGINQYAKATISTVGTWVAIGVRCTGTSLNGYWLYTAGSNVVIYRNLVTALQTISESVSNGDVLELRVVGSTLRAYKNGTQIGTDQADSTYQTGDVGLCIYSDAVRVDDFVGGDLTSGWAYEDGTPQANDADVIFMFESGSDGDTITATNVKAGAQPNPPWGTLSFSPSTPSTTKIESDGEKAIGGAFYVAGGLVNDASGSRGMRRDHAQSEEYVALAFPSAKDVASCGFWFRTSLPSSGYYVGHTMALFYADGSEYACFSLAPNNGSNHPVALEIASGATTDASVVIELDTWYWITLQYDKTGGKGRLALYNASLSKVGNTLEANLKSSPPQASGVYFGEHAAHSDLRAGVSLYDDFAIDWTDGTFPLMPVPSTSAVTIFMNQYRLRRA